MIGIRARRRARRGKRRCRPLGCLLILPILPLVLIIVVVIVVVADSTGRRSAAEAAPEQVPGIPTTMLAAYRRAAERTPGIAPHCQGMRWSILAAIAAVESQHAAGRAIADDGQITPPILGPVLDGSGVGGNRTPILNPDGSFARAQGPFQFLSSTWAGGAGRDGNDDGRADPHNAFDAALAAAGYLCGPSPRDLRDHAQLRAAIYNYNHSQVYVDKVLAHLESFSETTPNVSVACPTFQSTLQSGGQHFSGAALVAVRFACAQLGKPYVWGGNGEPGFDCSGLTHAAYAAAGIDLPRTAHTQYHAGPLLPRGAPLQPGDLIFFGTPSKVHHVGISLGGNAMVHAPTFGQPVQVGDPRSHHDLLAVSRPTGR